MPINWYTLSKKDVKSFLNEILKIYPSLVNSLSKFKDWKLARLRGKMYVYIAEGLPLMVRYRGLLLPTIKTIRSQPEVLPSVMIDDGALPHVINGADVMRPGIVKVKGDFKEGDIVSIISPHGEVIAIGRALKSWSEAFKVDKGKVIEVLHRVGDKIWLTLKGIKL